MSLPNVASAVAKWEQGVILKTVTNTTVDFEPVETVTAESRRMVVQVAEKEKLNLDSLDWSKEYKWFHSRKQIDIGQFIEYKGKDYKLVSQGDDYADYGYYAFAGEETKKELLVAS